MACNDPLILDTSPSYVRLMIPRGNDYGWFNCTIKDSQDDPIDITSATFEGGIKKLKADTSNLIEVEADVIDGPLGEFRFRFTESDVDGLAFGESITDEESQYFWYFDLIYAGGEKQKLYYGQVFIVA